MSLVSLQSCWPAARRHVVAWFSVIDQRQSSPKNKEHVQTHRPPLAAPLAEAKGQTSSGGCLGDGLHDDRLVPESP
ncbi:unnamed protein product [Gadus morhua 'NCC']